MSASSSGDGGKPLWADAHNHLHDPRLAGCTEDVPHCVVNATLEDVWSDVLATTAAAPGRATPLSAFTRCPSNSTTQQTSPPSAPQSQHGSILLHMTSRILPVATSSAFSARSLYAAHLTHHVQQGHTLGASSPSSARSPCAAHLTHHAQQGHPQVRRGEWERML